MPRTIKAALLYIQQKIRISMLKNKIRKMENSSYLDLWERLELRDAVQLLHGLEQKRHRVHNTAFLSLQ